MRSQLGAAAIGLCLALAACGGDDGALEGSVPSVTTTTTASTTTTTAPTTTTTTAAPPCPKIFEGAGNPAQVDVAADLDGDGRADRVHSWHNGGDADEGVWTVQVALAAGGGAAQDLAGHGVAGVGVIGGYDLDADGTDELWVRTGSGASAQILGLYRLDGCDLEPVTLDGQPVELPVGGGILSPTGVTCPLGRDVSLVVTSLSSDDGHTYAVTSTYYLYADGVLTKTDVSQSTATAGTPAFDAATGFDCGDLTV